MKVLALNGSPRAEKSSSYHMLKPLLQGMQDAGAEIDVIHIHHLKLKPCLGCYSCWTKTPGICVQRDGMSDALLRYLEADFLIFATPLYFSLMSGEMKTFIDRLLPLSDSRMEERRNDRSTTAHVRRYGYKQRGMLLVSPCGFPEYQNFDALLYSFKFLASKNDWTYTGEILRTGAEPLVQEDLQPLFSQYYSLLQQAGEQIVRQGCIDEDLQQALRKDLFPGGREKFYEMADAYWKVKTTEGNFLSDERKESNEMSDEKNVEISVSMKEVLQRMPQAFRPEVAADFEGDVQMNFSGEEPGQYYFAIGQGKCIFHDGVSAQPALTMNVASEDWRAIGRGELSGPEAFMSGRLKAEGDFSLLMKWSEIFAA